MCIAQLARPVVIANEVYKGGLGAPNPDVGLADLRSLIRGTAARTTSATKQIKSTHDLRRWVDVIGEILHGGHKEALVLGRRRAGDTVPENPRDEMVARAIMDSESEYLLRFSNQIAASDPRYWLEDGTMNVEAIAERVGLYSLKLRGSANTGWLGSQHVSEEISWVMHALEHCDDCPRLQAMGPYTKQTLFVVPGMGDTQCLFNCKCSLETKNGSSFPPL